MSFYFADHDSLERRSYADFLKGLIDNCDKYRRNEEEGAYVIAIDSAWGTGKSRFFSMFKNYLNGYLEENTTIAEHKQEYNVILYNAWDYDYWGDAMEPLMDCLMRSTSFTESNAQRESEVLTDSLLSAAGKIMKATAFFAGRKILGDEIVDLIKEIIDKTFESYKQSEEQINPFAALKQRTDAYEDFKGSLSDIIELSGQRFVILIDELDRCKPTFAIQTLELAKHLFDVKGMIFVFALDVKQLSCSIKTIYGAEMDAEGYLCRFFNYIGKMPLPDITCYVKRSLEKTYDNVLDDLTSSMYEICLLFNLSLRDIDTLIQNYHIMNTVFLKKYPNEAHVLYFFLLTLKYKDIILFDAIFKKATHMDFNKYSSPTLKCTETLKAHINTRTKIKGTWFSYYDYPADQPSNTIRVRSVDAKNMRFTYSQGSESNAPYTHPYGQLSSLSKILFPPDLENWESIKDMTITDYLYKQLEMFNFALQPSTEED